MTTYEYIRWKANNTRASKIVKKKSDKTPEQEKLVVEDEEKGHQDSPGPALPLNVDFMDSNKRLAGLMTIGKSSTDQYDAGFSKIDPTNAMANTATNFAAGVDREAIEK